MKLSRRYQVMSAIGWCEDCETSVIHGYDEMAENAAAKHASGTGHQVRVMQSRLIIIEPQPAGEADHG